MAIMPGAIYKPLPTKGRAQRRRGRGICLHVAVSEAPSLFGFFSTSTSDSHFYVRKDGTIEQYVDTDLVAYANATGNATLISVETQGGVTNANGEPWTPQQVAALGRLVKWCSAIDGFPLVPMPDSKAASRGVGYHRLGVKPWVVSGGEVWSSSVGKVCPGAGKIAQIPAVIAAAKGGSPTIVQEDELPSVNDILDAPIAQPNGGTTSLRMMVSWSDYHIDLTRAIIREQTAAVINGLLEAPIDRADVGRGSTTLRAILTWSDTNIDRILDAANKATQGNPNPADVAKLVGDAVRAEIACLRFQLVEPPAAGVKA